MFLPKLIVVSSVLFFSGSIAIADVVNGAFEQIKNSARHYKDPGAVCEEVSREEFEIKYPAPKYKILVGVSYNVNGRTLGELDLVVLDNESQQATIVGEVKCFKDMSKGLRKAKQQRQRFLESLSKFDKKISYLDLESDSRMSPEIFRNTREFISISQKGGRSVGFDHELGLNLEEMGKLREKMIQCQLRTECPLP